MLCFNVGHAEVMPLYVVPYYIVHFPNGSIEVFSQTTGVIGKTDMVHLLLAEFDITYVTRKYMKGKQSLTI